MNCAALAAGERKLADVRAKLMDLLRIAGLFAITALAEIAGCQNRLH